MLFLKKDFLYDFLSLANEIYQSKSIISKGFKSGKIYWLKNKIFNLINKKIKHLEKNIDIYNFFIKNSDMTIIKKPIKKKELVKRLIMLVNLEIKNKIVNKLFNTTCKYIEVISNF